MIVTSLKMTLKKAKPKNINKRSYKIFDSCVYIEHLHTVRK